MNVVLYGIALAILPLLAGGAAWNASIADGLAQLEAQSAAKLEAAAGRLDGQLARFRQLPRVLADAAPLARTAGFVLAAPVDDFGGPCSLAAAVAVAEALLLALDARQGELRPG